MPSLVIERHILNVRDNDTIFSIVFEILHFLISFSLLVLGGIEYFMVFSTNSFNVTYFLIIFGRKFLLVVHHASFLMSGTKLRLTNPSKKKTNLTFLFDKILKTSRLQHSKYNPMFNNKQVNIQGNYIKNFHFLIFFLT